MATTGLDDKRFAKLPSQVAAIVPRGDDIDIGEWNAGKLLNAGAVREMAAFSQFAVAAANEACADAGWHGSTASEEEKERAVRRNIFHANEHEFILMLQGIESKLRVFVWEVELEASTMSTT